MAASAATVPPLATHAAYATGHYRNLFSEYLGVTDAAIDTKLAATWHQLVDGDEDTQRLIYRVADDMAYIPDLPHRDVRTEGISYGMMIAVQLNHRAEFDQLWKFAKRFMYHESGPFRGYFAWHTAYDGRQLSPGPAPDGEEWFVTALFFAAHRWGNGQGIFNYEAEAQSLLRTMLHKHEQPDRGEVGDMIDREARQINFVPHGGGAKFTDPSYHLPAFYELWARWAAAEDDRTFLSQLAPNSRLLFRRAAHAKTGLMPDYAEFDGRPHVAAGHANFEYDAWRTLANVALDYTWWAADAWAVEQSNRVLRFLATQPAELSSRYKLDGTPVSMTWSPGLQAMAAVAALAADREIGEPFVRRFWEMKMPQGQYRYYDGMLTALALLEVSGRFRIYGPVNATP